MTSTTAASTTTRATRVAVQTRINAEETEFLCEPRQSLLECLRDVVGLTGTKEGCNDGNCGACSVLLDGRLVNSCLVLGVEAAGKEVTTIEGIAGPDGLHPLQQAFLEQAALQCGICTPGFIVAAKALLDREPKPTEERVRFWLSGNLCRCTGYDKIVRAVLATSEMQRQTAEWPRSGRSGRSGRRRAGGGDAMTTTKEPGTESVAPPRARIGARRELRPQPGAEPHQLRRGGDAPGTPRRRGQGHRAGHLRGRPAPARDAARQGPAQPPRPRPHPLPGRHQGPGATRGEGRGHGRGLRGSGEPHHRPRRGQRQREATSRTTSWPATRRSTRATPWPPWPPPAPTSPKRPSS